MQKGTEPVMLVTPFKHIYEAWLHQYTPLALRGAISKLKKNCTHPLLILREVKAMHPDIELCMEKVCTA